MVRNGLSSVYTTTVPVCCICHHFAMNIIMVLGLPNRQSKNPPDATIRAIRQIFFPPKFPAIRYETAGFMGYVVCSKVIPHLQIFAPSNECSNVFTFVYPLINTYTTLDTLACAHLSWPHCTVILLCCYTPVTFIWTRLYSLLGCC